MMSLFLQPNCTKLSILSLSVLHILQSQPKYHSNFPNTRKFLLLFSYKFIKYFNMEKSPCQKIYNEIMQKIGTNHRYQLFIIIFFTAAAFTTTAILIGASFIFMNPMFNCKQQQSSLITGDEYIACSQIIQCKLINDYTIVGQMKLYCDRQNLRSMIQSSLPIGSVLGLFIMNTLCDIKGRKWSIKICFLAELIGLTGTFLSALFDWPFLVALFQIFCTFGGYSLMMITYAIFYDVCNKNYVQNGIIALNIMWGFAEISFYFFDNWIKDWYVYMMFFLILPTIILMYLEDLLLIDPPCYLLYKGSWNQVLNSSIQISVINKTMTPTLEKQLQFLINQYKTIRQRKSYNKHGFKHLANKLLCRWKYLKRIILLTLLYGSGSLFYYGVQYAINNIGLSYGTNMLILGIMEAAAFIILKFTQAYAFSFPRKKGAIIFFGNAAIIGLLSIMPIFTKSKQIATVAISLCRLSTTFGTYFFILLQTQSFSPDVRSTGIGLTEGLSQLGSFISPPLVNILINSQINPIGVLSLLLLLFGVFPTFFGDQTLKQNEEKDEPFLNRQKSYQVSSLQIY